MTLPGLSLFYGGLVRTKNVLSVIAWCFGITILVTVFWYHESGYGALVGGGLQRRVWKEFQQSTPWVHRRPMVPDPATGEVPVGGQRGREVSAAAARSWHGRCYRGVHPCLFHGASSGSSPGRGAAEDTPTNSYYAHVLFTPTPSQVSRVSYPGRRARAWIAVRPNRPRCGRPAATAHVGTAHRRSRGLPRQRRSKRCTQGRPERQGRQRDHPGRSHDPVGGCSRSGPQRLHDDLLGTRALHDAARSRAFLRRPCPHEKRTVRHGPMPGHRGSGDHPVVGRWIQPGLWQELQQPVFRWHRILLHAGGG